MAYQTGTATDPADLLDKLRLFALANGFTVNFWGDRTAGVAPRKALQLTKGALVGSFLSDSTFPGTTANPGTYVGVYCHNAYAGGGGTENQAGASAKCYSNGMAGPYQAYHFFCDNGGGANPYLHMVVETGAGYFRHIGMGRLDTIGAVTTGLYCFASNWNYTTSSNQISDPNYTGHAWPFDSVAASQASYPATQLRADSDSISPRWYTDYAAAFGSRFSGGVRGSEPVGGVGNQSQLLYGPINSSASQRTGRSILAPCLVAVDRTASLQSPLGAPPNMRWVMLRYLDPGQTITLGPDTWKVFPVIRKLGSTGQPNSDLYGYAYLVN